MSQHEKETVELKNKYYGMGKEPALDAITAITDAIDFLRIYDTLSYNDS